MRFFLDRNDAVELPSAPFPDRVPSNIGGSQSTIARSFSGLVTADGARTTALGGARHCLQKRRIITKGAPTQSANSLRHRPVPLPPPTPHWRRDMTLWPRSTTSGRTLAPLGHVAHCRDRVARLFTSPGRQLARVTTSTSVGRRISRARWRAAPVRDIPLPPVKRQDVTWLSREVANMPEQRI